MSAPTHILTSHLDELQEKGQDTAELEHIKQPVDQPNLETESRFASLGRLAAARVFWKSILWAFLASVGALFDGYAIVIPGSIVANKGSIATFGTVHSASGVVSLDAKIVGAWGGIQSAGQIVSMWSGPFLSDRFGRKSVMYLVCLWVMVAAVLEITATNWKTYLFAIPLHTGSRTIHNRWRLASRPSDLPWASTRRVPRFGARRFWDPSNSYPTWTRYHRDSFQV